MPLLLSIVGVAVALPPVERCEFRGRQYNCRPNVVQLPPQRVHCKTDLKRQDAASTLARLRLGRGHFEKASRIVFQHEALAVFAQVEDQFLQRRSNMVLLAITVWAQSFKTIA